ncbi:MAG: PAS domain S-box protein [Paludibacteraceae bacterium]|nr:PAS domain S-box protein [Paludibacteraceae bacterium]
MDINNIRILAIDDNSDNLITIKALLLESFPAAIVFTADSGQKGIEEAKKIVPDVILLDILMPGMDGYETCRKLKQINELVDTPVVFVTAIRDEKESRIKGLEAGAEAFLSKPIDESELKAQIRAMFKIRQASLTRHNEHIRLSDIINERTRELELTHKATLNLLEDLKNENEQRRRTEAELRKSEARLQRAELASKSGNWELDLDERMLYASVGAKVLLGTDKNALTPEEVLAMTLLEYHQPFKEKYINLVENNETFSIEVKIRNQISNEIIDLLCLANFDEKQRRAFGVIQDITEQKLMQQALADSEALYKAVLNSTPDIVLTTDTQGKIVMASPTILSTYGYDDYNELSTKMLLDFIHPDDYSRAVSNFTNMQQGIHSGPHEYKSIRKDGSTFDIEVKGGSIKDKDGIISKLVFIARDVTERKKAEVKLIRSEAEFRAVWENSGSGLRLTDSDGNIVRVNDAYCRIYGRTQEELTGAKISAVYPLGDTERKLRKHRDRFKNRKVDSYVEKEITLWNGQRKWVQVENSFLDIESENPLLLGVFTEITARKHDEEKIKHLSRLYALIGQVNQSIVRTHDTRELLERICNIAVLYGHFRMAWIGLYDESSDNITPMSFAGYEAGYMKSLEPVIQNISKGIGPTTQALISKEIVCTNNVETDKRLLLTRDEALQRGYKSFASIPLLLQNKVYGILSIYAGETDFFNNEELKLLSAIGEDISFALNAIEADKTRKAAEEALLESENRYITFVNNNVDMIFVKDENFRYLVANDAMAQFFNKNVDDILNKTDAEISGPEVHIPCSSSDRQALMSDKPVIGVEKLGERFYELTKFQMLLKNGKTGIGGILHDITHRREAEKALEESRLELKAIYDNAPVMLCVLDESRRIIFQNMEFSEFTHQLDDHTIGKLIGNVLGCIGAVDYGDCGAGPDCDECTLRNAVDRSISSAIGQRNFEHHTTLVLNGEEKEIYLLGSTAVIETSGKRKILLTLYDITRRKQAEQELEKSEMFLRTFIDNTPFQIWARDTRNVGILENKMMQDKFGTIIGKKPSEDPNIETETALLWEQQNQMVMQGKLIDEEIEYQIKGKKLNFHQIIFPVYVNGRVIAIAGFDIDITDRIKAQEQIKNFAAHLQNIREEERVVLAREIHDDLGQILVAIKIDLGLLGMKAQKFIREEASEEFMTHFKRLAGQVDNTIKTARRIMSNLRPEVLDILGFEDAVRSYINSFSERFNISCTFDCEISDFKIEQQHSLALFRIIQESLNNVAKHAFASKVDINIAPVNDKKIALTISDNGKGFDIQAKRRNDSYGLIGMKERAYLLEAVFHIESEPGQGTHITITMPYNATKK